MRTAKRWAITKVDCPQDDIYRHLVEYGQKGFRLVTVLVAGPRGRELYFQKEVGLDEPPFERGTDGES